MMSDNVTKVNFRPCKSSQYSRDLTDGILRSLEDREELEPGELCDAILYSLHNVLSIKGAISVNDYDTEKSTYLTVSNLIERAFAGFLLENFDSELRGDYVQCAYFEDAQKKRDEERNRTIKFTRTMRDNFEVGQVYFLRKHETFWKIVGVEKRDKTTITVFDFKADKELSYLSYNLQFDENEIILAPDDFPQSMIDRYVQMIKKYDEAAREKNEVELDLVNFLGIEAIGM